MRHFRLIFVLPLLLAAGLPAQAASSFFETDHVRVELLVPGNQLYIGDWNEAGLYFKLEPGWHIYWRNPGDAGEPPHIQWKLPAGITAGPMQFPAPKRLPLGPLMDYGYEDEVLFPLRLIVSNEIMKGGVRGNRVGEAGPYTLHAKIDWLVCRGSCIPGKAELEVQRNVFIGDYDLATKPGLPLSVRFFNTGHKSLPDLPRPLPASAKAVFQSIPTGIRLTVETGKQETQATFFPADQDILDNPAPQKLTPTVNGLILDLKKDANLTANPTQLKGVLELSGGRAYEIVALPLGVTAPTPAYSASVTATSTTSSSSAPINTPRLSWSLLLRTSCLAFLGGLLLNLMPCVFPVLFLKGLALVHTGHRELHRLRTHGLVYAAGILVSFWALVGVLLGLRAAGATLGWGFQFQSPVFLALMAGLLFFLGLSLAGQFEIGLTLTSAGGSLAAKQGYTGSFFTGVLAVVVATPCTAPFMGAAIGYALAQSALVTFAVFTALALGLAAPYVALTLQPAWTRILPKPGAWMEVLRQAVAVPIFVTVIWLAWVLAAAYGAGVLAALLASFLLLAIAGWFLGRWPTRRWATAVAALILLGVVALAVFGQWLVGETPGKAGQPGSTELNSVAANGWEPWSAAAVSRYQAQGRPVFVDFTASWCLSCQVNERVALNQPQVKQAFQSANVALLRADWTRHDEAITQALTALGRSGVPAYALYSPGETSPRLLPEVLTPGIVMDALSKLPKTATRANSSASNLK
jgi:thiol:disulfide interchange protein DsbD